MTFVIGIVIGIENENEKRKKKMMMKELVQLVSLRISRERQTFRVCPS